MFSKKDIKTGMTVMLRSKKYTDKFMVLLDTPKGDIIVCNDGYLEFRQYEDDLTFTSRWDDKDDDDEFDIMQVYVPTARLHLQPDRLDDQTIAYDRNTITRVTKQDVADKFGIDVKYLTIEED